MGGPIANHLVAAGHEVRVFDRVPEATAARAAAGATGAESPAEAARGASFVSVVVFDDDQATAVVEGPGGVLESAAPGTVVAVHTTVTLETIRRLADHGAKRGVVVIDAGISGGEAGAVAGTLVTLVGGPAEVVDHVRPILLAFSKEVVHAGPLGAGMALKLARNAAGYAMMHAVYEAMVLAAATGVDLAQLQHTITATGMFEQALAPFEFGGPAALPADAPAESRASLEHTSRLAAKDLDHALDLAARAGAFLPALAVIRRHFHRVVRLEHPPE